MKIRKNATSNSSFDPNYSSPNITPTDIYKVFKKSFIFFVKISTPIIPDLPEFKRRPPITIKLFWGIQKGQRDRTIDVRLIFPTIWNLFKPFFYCNMIVVASFRLGLVKLRFEEPRGIVNKKNGPAGAGKKSFFPKWL